MTTTFARPRSPICAVPAFAFAGLVGLIGGVGTLWLRARLPADWSLLGDSGGLWTLVAFAAAALVGGPRWQGIIAGTLALLAEVAGYYDLGARDLTALAAPGEIRFWLAAAVVIGPFAGLAGHAARTGTRGRSVVALVALAGVLVGEAAFLLRHGEPSAGARAQLLAGLALAAVGLVARRAGATASLGALVVGAATAAATWAAYELG